MSSRAIAAPSCAICCGDLNLAVRVREGCSKLSVVGTGMRGTPGVVHQVVDALSRVNVEIIHCTDSNVTISVLVPADEIVQAESAVHDAVRSRRRRSTGMTRFGGDRHGDDHAVRSAAARSI